MTPTSETLFVDSREQVIMAQTGAVGAQGSEDVMRLVLQGLCPSGDTSENVTYFVIDTATNTVAGHVVLPNAVKKKTSVSLSVKVLTPVRPIRLALLMKTAVSMLEFSERTQSHQRPTCPRGHYEGLERSILSHGPGE